MRNTLFKIAQFYLNLLNIHSYTNLWAFLFNRIFFHLSIRFDYTFFSSSLFPLIVCVMIFLVHIWNRENFDKSSITFDLLLRFVSQSIVDVTSVFLRWHCICQNSIFCFVCFFYIITANLTICINQWAF